MFVSSYSTYIGANSQDKINQRTVTDKKSDSKLFSTNLLEAVSNKPTIYQNLPIDYVFNYKSFNTQQKLQEQVKTPIELEFQKIKNIKSAKSAYEDNTKVFSLFTKPTVTLQPTTQKSTHIPQDIQELKDNKMRHIMVNTYLANDNYYRVTA